MKSQVGQIFIYVITIVLVGFLLFYGYNAITGFKDKADQVSYIQFKNSLQNTAEVLSLDYGSVKVKEFVVPDSIVEVCVVRNFPELPTLANTNYPIIEDSVNSKVDKNIFLVGKEVEDSFIIPKVYLEEDMKCFEVIGNKMKLKLEGRGDHTIIS